jgi:Yip1-like protein
VSARALPAPVDERVWLKRAVTVLVRPRVVFEAIRDDSDTAARVRSEAVLALVLLAGIASVLWTPTYGKLLDDVANDALNVAVIAFIGGSLYGALGYFLGGLVLYAVTRAVGGATYRQVRHVLAFASAPVALSLFVVWPVRLAVYGQDVFRSGGSDHGTGNEGFYAVELLFVFWALGLVALGLYTVLSRNPGVERL